MNDDVSAEFNRLAQVWRRERIVDYQRHASLPGHLCDRFNVEHIDLRIAHGLGVDCARLWRNGLAEVFGIVGIHEDGMDAELPERYVKLRIGAAVQRTGRNDFVALA